MTSHTSAPFTDALAAGALVLDGGLSNQLGAAGHDLSDELWSARLLADRPEAITEAHLAYFEAGANVAITSSYQASFEGFAKRGIERDRAAELIALSVELALDAAVEAGRRGIRRRLYVAASVGPYGAMLADGSEYRGRYGLSVAELEAFHRPRMEVLAAVGPDALALETIPDTTEAEALLRAARGLGCKPGCRTRSRVTAPVPGSRWRRRSRWSPRRTRSSRSASTAAPPRTSRARSRRRPASPASRSWSTPTAARPGTRRPARGRAVRPSPPNRSRAGGTPARG